MVPARGRAAARARCLRRPAIGRHAQRLRRFRGLPRRRCGAGGAHRAPRDLVRDRSRAPRRGAAGPALRCRPLGRDGVRQGEDAVRRGAGLAGPGGSQRRRRRAGRDPPQTGRDDRDGTLSGHAPALRRGARAGAHAARGAGRVGCQGRGVPRRARRRPRAHRAAGGDGLRPRRGHDLRGGAGHAGQSLALGRAAGHTAALFVALGQFRGLRLLPRPGGGRVHHLPSQADAADARRHAGARADQRDRPQPRQRRRHQRCASWPSPSGRRAGCRGAR